MRMEFSQNRILDIVGGGVYTAGGLVLLLSCVPFLRNVFWMFEIPGHFRVPFAGCLLLAAIIMAVYRRWLTVGVFLMAASINGTVLIPFYLPAPEPQGTEERSFRMVLFNVNSSIGNPERVRSYLEKKDFDLVILQEYSQRWAKEMSTLAYPHRLEAVREDNFGMAVFSRFPFQSSDIVYLTEQVLPSLRVELNVNGQPLHVLATHPVPPVSASNTAARNEQLDVLARSRTEEGAFLLAGDLNTTPWSPEVRHIRRSADLRDSADGFGFRPTWPAGTSPLWTILDHVLYSEELNVMDRSLGPALGSDHYPVEVAFHL